MTDNALIKFNNDNFGNVRALLIDGDPWFVGKDVAKALGYKNGNRDVNRHVDNEDRKGYRIGTHGSEATLINESGLYALIFGSKLDKAKQFKRWVTSELLPTLRKTGTYTLERDARWLETRQGTKTSHRPFTDAIKMLIEYLESRGQKFHDIRYVYGHLTNLIQNRCGVQRGQRDNTPVANLNKLDQVQSMVANIVLKRIDEGRIKTLAEVEATIILQLNAFDRLLGGDMFLLEGAA